MKLFKYDSKMNELELMKLLTQFIIYNLNKSKNSTEFFKTLQKSNIQTVLDKKKDFLFKQSKNGSITCKIWNKQSIDLLTQEQIKNGWSGVEVTTSDSEHLKNKIGSWLKHKKNGSILDISLTPESSLKGLTLEELKETLGDRKLNDLELEHVKNNLLSEQVSDQELKESFAMTVEKPCAFTVANDPELNPEQPEPTNKKPRKKRNLKLW
ncbi:hypothetical protein CGH80_18940 [Vibrio parahaemolyticus]|uniref:hypothetical protein n=2 Tax=Vibrio parahaemolyticus TaxID=670 RepID=UPI001123AD37|nr:hypothetical protein [Vibrio parahaemolyticus]EJG0913650.1 hypothetical protein [Vibrio parahaemolyticus]TOM31671.1 hypothetical protein CGH80_18940 [Vibrio parahaemolyticus]